MKNDRASDTNRRDRTVYCFTRCRKGFLAIPEVEENSKNQKKEKPAGSTALWICIAMLVLALSSGWPYGYYTLLRWVVCLTAGYLTYENYESGRRKFTLIFGVVALLFNPVVPIHLSKSEWAPIDLVVAGFLFFYVMRGKIIRLNFGKGLRKKLLLCGGALVCFLIALSAWSQYRYSAHDYPVYLASSQSNFHPEQYLKDIKGELNVQGWRVKPVAGKPHTFLVSYTYSIGAAKSRFRLLEGSPSYPTKNLFDGTLPSTWGWWWEVNTQVPLVRSVVTDSELAKKYGVVMAPLPPPTSRIGNVLQNGGASSSNSTDKFLLLVGELSDVSADGLIHLRDMYGFITPIIVTNSTMINSRQGSSSFENLKTGMRVEVEYRFDMNTAKRYAVAVRIQ